MLFFRSTKKQSEMILKMILKLDHQSKKSVKKKREEKCEENLSNVFISDLQKKRKQENFIFLAISVSDSLYFFSSYFFLCAGGVENMMKNLLKRKNLFFYFNALRSHRFFMCIHEKQVSGSSTKI